MSKPLRFIPFNRFCPVGTEFELVQQAIDGMHVSGDGKFTQLCHQLLEQLLGVPKVLLTTSCTDALEMAALLNDLRPGDEVIVPSYTFVSTANAFAIRGAKPVFADVRPDTLNLNEKLLDPLITPRTRLLVVVHYAGVGCEMDSIMSIAGRHGISVIEDNAHGLFGKYKGRFLGTFGSLATQSFHETKNFTCGEGGALLVNAKRFVDRAEILRDKGTNRKRFFRGEVDKYTWVDVGSSFLPSDILAAFLYAQLQARDSIQEARKRIWNYYWQHLWDWAAENGVTLPTIPDHCEHPAHMFYMLLPSLEARARLLAELKAKGILCVFHYQPLHLSDMGREFGGRPGDCPVAEQAGDRLVRLPFFNDLNETDQNRVIEAIRTLTF
ncbi:MAG: dTDP-4-amino-4,6-dideoxygalactose transaminase [Acidobacteria bacterium]|nr:dTDP-4-amino-4,6-dideoxygalactose transaminase [Acidobacteriota bacterium]